MRTVDGVEHPADLIVLATGYELWTDPETYRPGTILGATGSTSPSTTAPRDCRAMPVPRTRACPTGGRSSGPLGFVGFAWPDFVETMAAHAVRIIDEARHRGRNVVAVSQEAFNRWNESMDRRGKTAHLYSPL